MKKLLAALLGMVVVGFSMPAFAIEPSEPQLLVDEARITLKDFQQAPNMGWFREALRDARGVLVVPRLLKAGLIFGGSGGKGVFFVKDENDAFCKGPAFYNMGSVTFGAQAGGEEAQVVILAMNGDAVNAMLTGQFKLGADMSVAAGPVGVGAARQGQLPTADFIAFSRAKGLFAGLTVEGTVVTVNNDYNLLYYGKAVNPIDIIVGGVSGPKDGICALLQTNEPANPNM